MDLVHAPTLADALRAYYEPRELAQFCADFDIELEFQNSTPDYVRLARRLISEIEIGNNRRFLEAIVPSLVNRAAEGVARQTFERQDLHKRMLERLRPLEEELAKPGLPGEVAVAENHRFAAKSEARALLGEAGTEVLVVDNYVGAGTLDCLLDVKQPIRLLTGMKENSINADFDRALEEFRSEGRSIEVRRHPKLHDRYVVFNDRCWLVGGSLKDAGRKAFNMIEVVDSKEAITEDAERKWTEATTYP